MATVKYDSDVLMDMIITAIQKAPDDWLPQHLTKRKFRISWDREDWQGHGVEEIVGIQIDFED